MQPHAFVMTSRDSPGRKQKRSALSGSSRQEIYQVRGRRQVMFAPLTQAIGDIHNYAYTWSISYEFATDRLGAAAALSVIPSTVNKPHGESLLR